jgi:hypothetical protein
MGRARLNRTHRPLHKPCPRPKVMYVSHRLGSTGRHMVLVNLVGNLTSSHVQLPCNPPMVCPGSPRLLSLVTACHWTTPRKHAILNYSRRRA